MCDARRRPGLLRTILLLLFAIAVALPQVRESLRPEFAVKVEVVVEDAVSGQPVPARIYLFKSGNPFRLSPIDVLLPLRIDAFYRERLWRRRETASTLEVTARDASHVLLLHGRAIFDLPRWDDYRIEAYRGHFYEPAVAEFSLRAGEEKQVRLELQPIAPGRQEQWLAADGHIHLMRAREDDAVFLQWLQAEDLAVGNFLELQRQQHAALQYAFGEQGEARALGYSIRSGHESRSRFYGHTLFLGPRRMVRPLSIGLDYANSPEAYPFPAVLFAQGRELGALTGFAHFYGSQPNSTLLMNLALGNLDFVEIFQFGQLRTEPWYELLNAGLRVIGLAGSDFPVPMNRRDPWPRTMPLLGPERALVKARPGSSAYESWSEGVRRGAVHLTNGPLLEFEVNGHTAGDAIDWRGSELRLKGRATAVWSRPIERLEIIVNGVAAASVEGNGQPELSIEFDLLRAESVWVAAHARAQRREGEPEIRAHTNPVWFHRDGRPVHLPAARQAVARRWRNETAYYRNPSLVFPEESQRERLLQLVEQAQEILASPPRPWN